MISEKEGSLRKLMGYYKTEFLSLLWMNGCSLIHSSHWQFNILEKRCLTKLYSRQLRNSYTHLWTLDMVSTKSPPVFHLGRYNMILQCDDPSISRTDVCMGKATKRGLHMLLQLMQPNAILAVPEIDNESFFLTIHSFPLMDHFLRGNTGQSKSCESNVRTPLVSFIDQHFLH